MKIRMRQNPNQVTAKAAEERFISKKIAENCANRTIEYYRIRIGQFLDYYGPDELVSEITEDTFDGYIYHLRTTTSANDITINSYLRAVRTRVRPKFYLSSAESGEEAEGDVYRHRVKVIAQETRCQHVYIQRIQDLGYDKLYFGDRQPDRDGKESQNSRSGLRERFNYFDSY